MKPIFLIFVTLFTISGLCAFQQGTINPGGTISYSSHSYKSGSDPVTFVQVAPQVGYFMADNLAIDLMVNYQGYDYGNNEDSDTSGYDYSTLGLGLGFKYYYDNFYGGAGLVLQSYKDDLSYQSRYVQLNIGELLPLAKSVYLDFGLAYSLGFGNYTGDAVGTNKETQLDLFMGIQVFIPTK
jgi:hypothetical protein